MLTLETIFAKAAQTVAVLFIISAAATLLFTVAVLVMLPFGSTLDFSHFNMLIGRKLTTEEINQLAMFK